MEKILNKKQKAFVREIIKDGNGVRAVQKSYNPTTYSAAGAIASQNLDRPYIVNAITKLMDEVGLDNKSVLKMHLKLLNKKEVVTHFDKDGNFQVKETGEIDRTAVKDAIEINNKLRGLYGREKNDNQNVNIAFIVNNYERN